MKAGFLLKKKGVWILTAEGDKVTKLSAEELYEKAHLAYLQWDIQNKKTRKSQESEEELNNDIEESNIVKIDQLESQALDGIIKRIREINAYEFQDLVAALLRGMGYFINGIAEPGKDGGVDIVVYVDPLGAKPPRIKVQVKHKPDSAVPVDNIRSLIGVLSSDQNVGLFVTSGVFSSDAKKAASSSHIHIRLIDINEFINLWIENYNKMTHEDQSLLPLHPIYFIEEKIRTPLD